jgi:hypothetical protein
MMEFEALPLLPTVRRWAHPLRRHPFNVAGPPNLLSGCGPAAHAHSREFGAKSSLFVHGENHVRVS